MSEPTADAITTDGLARRKLKRPDSRRIDGFQVVARRSALREIQEHAATRLDVEVCGVLAGELFRDVSGPYLLIAAAVPGHAAAQHGASVTFTAETWQGLTEKMDRDHPDLKVCGWYHTHPDFGVFLSDADVFIHRNFFDLPWQPAIVCDPVRGDLGSFVWRGGELVREPMIVEEERGGHKWTVHHRAERLAGAGRGLRFWLAAALLLVVAGAVGGLAWVVSQGIRPGF